MLMMILVVKLDDAAVVKIMSDVKIIHCLLASKANLFSGFVLGELPN